MHIASPQDEIIKPKVFKVTLRDGRVFVIGGMSVSQLKFLRKHGGELTLKKNENGEEVKVQGKLIKHIEPLISLCAIIGHDCAMSFGGVVTSCCLRCGADPESECEPLKFYSLPSTHGHAFKT